MVEGLGQEAKIKNLKVLPLDDCDSLKKVLDPGISRDIRSQKVSSRKWKPVFNLRTIICQ